MPPESLPARRVAGRWPTETIELWTPTMSATQHLCPVPAGRIGDRGYAEAGVVGDVYYLWWGCVVLLAGCCWAVVIWQRGD